MKAGEVRIYNHLCDIHGLYTSMESYGRCPECLGRRSEASQPVIFQLPPVKPESFVDTPKMDAPSRVINPPVEDLAATGEGARPSDEYEKLLKDLKLVELRFGIVERQFKEANEELISLKLRLDAWFKK